ncbi:hypothetical protein [Collimonas arenae]|nr:hypothetical protein [Collimonas arenae]
MIKKILAVLLLVGATGVTGAAQASEYGCTVLLCLANPNGPTAAPYCVSFINRLYDDLTHGRPFPSCDMSDKNDNGANYAQMVNDPYDPCPDPLQAAPQGINVVQALPNGSTVDTPQLGDQTDPTNGNGKRACVGKLLSSYQAGNIDDGNYVNVYDKVVWQKQQSPMAIDVYMQRKFSLRIHLNSLAQ